MEGVRRAWRTAVVVVLGALMCGMATGCALLPANRPDPGSAGVHSPTATSVGQPTAGSSAFVTTDGQAFLFEGHPIKLYGYTFYPATAGGTAAWRQSTFPQYIDHTLDLGLAAGQNLARPTDYWDKSSNQQTYTDPVIWANMDYLVQAAQKRGMFVLMDLSAYKWLLMSQGRDPYNATNWTPFLDFIGARYSNAPNIAAYSIVGEPPAPHTSAATSALVSFYRQVSDELYRADGGHHLIAAGGFNHMEDETPQTQWWQQIYALPHNDIVAFKTYSQHDLDLMPAIASYASSLRKPLMDEEFGMPQYTGDGAFSGTPYNGITTDRATFFDTVYTRGEQLGVYSFVFWNLGCQQGVQSYEVSPETPAVWQIITQHGAVPGVAWQSSTPPC